MLKGLEIEKTRDSTFIPSDNAPKLTHAEVDQLLGLLSNDDEFRSKFVEDRHSALASVP